ncbi:translationally-controlled tumor protein homolog [Branchiostoma floridae]|uniref:Translationally-controlled tumor protein homolog n=1 Tax=Branchiostoma floridae TaxID=7739 RepID=C3YEG0_BRAFL|nr:translationally-controlled tumor protein homolog [Branchiostoma floridae]|eukprot:XP_002605458.1 hypothetical protein BRAFLDRAFT_74272 [Branchiostoma floridae]
MGPRRALLSVLFLCAVTTHLSAGLIIYKDVISGDEMFSDIYKIKTFADGFFYDVEGKLVTTQEYLISLDSYSDIIGVDIAVNHNLQETNFTKDEYKTYIKEYLRRVKAYLDPDRVHDFRAAAQGGIDRILKSFDGLKFFTGESKNCEGMVALLDYMEDGVTPYMLFFKDGLVQEKA